MSIFDAKNFNAEVFGTYASRVPNTKRNELIKAGVFQPKRELKAMLGAQTGGNYVTIPYFGLIDGTPDNYDGNTDLNSTSTKTYVQSLVVVGRAKGWTEKDFSYDITQKDFMKNIAAQVGLYWDEIDQKTVLTILEGIFKMTGAKNLAFVNGHTYDISQATESFVGPATLNSAIQKACGDNKGIFKVAIMHSVVATNLENQNLLDRLKYTDKEGIQRDLNLGQWNGRLVLIDDSMPVESVTEDENTYDVYTTYLLGTSAFTYADVGALVPYEASRNASKNGGENTLYTRQRKVFGPSGISFTKKSMASLSPTDAELKNPANWTLVASDADASSVIDHKAIPIARIISRG